MNFWHQQLTGPTDPARDANWESPPPRTGFFTDTSICIGCKACEVACKEWNHIPEDGLSLLATSYDNTGSLGASTWRHVAFIEQSADQIRLARESGRAAMGERSVDLEMPAVRPAEGTAQAPAEAPLPDFRWLMASDVCKHCTHAGCLDVCPTGALFRTEFGTVVVQADVCNGCGYCVPACPFGVIERRDGDDTVTNSGVAQKCTLCYDRIGAGQTPACAQACPTTSITYGDFDQLHEQAHERVNLLHAQGFTEARLYGADLTDGVGGTGSIFLLLDEPEVYGLPPDPVVSTTHLPAMFRAGGWAATAMIAATVVSFVGRRG